MPGKNLYAILGLEKGAELLAIKRAYGRLTVAVHPDLGTAPDPLRFREIHAA